MHPKKLAANEILSEIKRTLPIGVELHRFYHYVVPLGKRYKLSLIVLKVHRPDELTFKLNEWRDEMANSLDMVTILIRPVKSEQNIRSNLVAEFRGSEILTEQARPKLEQMLESLCGSPPEYNQSEFKSIERREDLTAIPFIAIDRADTRDIEDLIHAEKKANKTLVWRAAFVSATDHVQPGSAIDKYALRVASTIYGRHRTVTTLGPQLSHDIVSFVPGQRRSAWIVEGWLIPSEAVTIKSHRPFTHYQLQYKIRHGYVVNHRSIDPTNTALNESDPSIANSIACLAEVARVLQQKRSSKPSLLRVDGERAIELILAEIMIESKRLLSDYLGRVKELPMIYRVHQKPSREVVEQFDLALDNLQIPHEFSDFETPSQFAGILQTLGNRRDPESQALLNNLLDTFLLRTLYSPDNFGHYGLRVDSYAEFKPRDASGLANQYQLAAAFNASPPISYSEMLERANVLNEKRWRRDERAFRLIFLEMLYDKLGLVGSACLATVAEVRPDKIYIEVQGFSKWGTLQVNDTEISFEVGAPVVATLVGFSLEQMRFVFKEESDGLWVGQLPSNP
jgi:exoribonuclease R